jgi:eukaryotic-like serine/threonine-protein kinase
MVADRFGIVGRVVASAYQVESVVAEGGFGVVYRAHHGGFRAPVALKCLKVPQHLAGNQQARFLEQFRAEGEVMFRLSASLPSVVRPLHVDAMTAPNGAFVPFMVLEWLEGETLDSIISGRAKAHRPPLALEEVIELLDPVARTLARAHHFPGPTGTETIVHCDLKPENVFVATSAGERIVKILDYGVSEVQRAATRAEQGAGAPSVALFTPAYGAPEQWNAREFGSTGPWTDVWGLALTITEALVGRPVIAGDHQSVMRQVLDPMKRPTPRTHGAVVSDAVEGVLAQALALNPKDRPHDAGVFWRALLDAKGQAATAFDLPTSAIPDLVPVPRMQSGAHKLDLPGVQQLDFDAGEGGQELSLALDVAPGELVRQRSLAPLSPSVPSPGAVSGPAGSSPPPSLGRRAATPALGVPASRSTPAPAVPLGPPQTMAEAIRSSLPPQPPSSEPARAKALEPLARRVVPGLAVAGSSIGLTLLDRIYVAITGEVFALGPLKTSMVAGVLLVVGLALAGRELLRKNDE